MPLLAPKKDRSFLERAQKSVKAWREELTEQAAVPDTPVKPQAVASALNKLLPNNCMAFIRDKENDNHDMLTESHGGEYDQDRDPGYVDCQKRLLETCQAALGAIVPRPKQAS